MDLRKKYVKNFPSIKSSYELYFPEAKERHLQESVSDIGLGNETSLRDDRGELVAIHGNLELFVDRELNALRSWPGESKYVVPEHDLLFAGFPCQPFSKSGSQLGFQETRGTIFGLIYLILEGRRPPLVMLENVGNFPRHDGGQTWSTVKASLEHLGYRVSASTPKADGGPGLISPHNYGIPHNRERFFVLAELKESIPDLGNSIRKFPANRVVSRNSIVSPSTFDDVIQKVSSKCDVPVVKLSDDRKHAVDHWNQLLFAISKAPNKGARRADKMISQPIWGFELDPWNWYPIDENPREAIDDDFNFLLSRQEALNEARDLILDSTNDKVDLFDYPPASDRIVEGSAWKDSLPGYAIERVLWPTWKKKFIEANREWSLWLWCNIDPSFFRDWLDKLYTEVPIHSSRKLEWNCKDEILDIYEHLIQFRPSGIRVKRRNVVPALVAMNETQVPVFHRQTELGSFLSHLSPNEALAFQGFPPTWSIPSSRPKAFKATGNAVHCELVAILLQHWLTPILADRPGFSGDAKR